MNSSETSLKFESDFNLAVSKKDWAAVKKLGENAIANGSRHPQILYNLALSYIKTDDPAGALPVLLGATPNSRDQQFELLLEEALRLTGHDRSDLDLSAHGLTGVLISTSRQAKNSDPWMICAVFFPTTLILIGLWTRWKRNFSSLNLRIFKPIVIISTAVSSLATIFGLSLIVLLSAYRGSWCGVTTKESIGIRALPSQDSEVVKDLKPGTPVFAFDDPTKPWAYGLVAGGASGWINTLDVRCVSE